jgi:hypothetical protein
LDSICERFWKKIIGKPYSGKPNVRFDEGELEIELSATTPALYSTEGAAGVFSDRKSKRHPESKSSFQPHPFRGHPSRENNHLLRIFCLLLFYELLAILTDAVFSLDSASVSTAPHTHQV